MGRTYLPEKEGELALWSERFLEQIIDNAAQWEIPHNEVNNLEKIVEEYNKYFKIIDSPLKTKIDVVKKNVAKIEMSRQIRAMTSFRLRNPVITDDQRIALGLRIKNRKRKPIPQPDKAPLIYLQITNGRQLSVEFRDPETNKRAKPYGISGILILFQVRNTLPTEPEDLEHNVLATRTPHKLTFSEEDRGKKTLHRRTMAK
jgi:hypothetical protein